MRTRVRVARNQVFRIFPPFLMKIWKRWWPRQGPPEPPQKPPRPWRDRRRKRIFPRRARRLTSLLIGTARTSNGEGTSDPIYRDNRTKARRLPRFVVLGPFSMSGLAPHRVDPVRSSARAFYGHNKELFTHCGVLLSGIFSTWRTRLLTGLTACAPSV